MALKSCSAGRKSYGFGRRFFFQRSHWERSRKGPNKVGITLNKNMIPDDPRGPMIRAACASGVPAVTTRGHERERDQDDRQLDKGDDRNHKDEKKLKEIHKEVVKLCKKFPIYKI